MRIVFFVCFTLLILFSSACQQLPILDIISTNNNLFLYQENYNSEVKYSINGGFTVDRFEMHRKTIDFTFLDIVRNPNTNEDSVLVLIREKHEEEDPFGEIFITDDRFIVIIDSYLEYTQFLNANYQNLTILRSIAVKPRFEPGHEGANDTYTFDFEGNYVGQMVYDDQGNYNVFLMGSFNLNSSELTEYNENQEILWIKEGQSPAYFVNKDFIDAGGGSYHTINGCQYLHSIDDSPYNYYFKTKLIHYNDVFVLYNNIDFCVLIDQADPVSYTGYSPEISIRTEGEEGTQNLILASYCYEDNTCFMALDEGIYYAPVSSALTPFTFTEDGPVRVYVLFPTQIEIPNNNRLLFMTQDKNKILWVGDEQGNVYKIDPTTKNVSNGRRFGLSRYPLKQLYFDPDAPTIVASYYWVNGETGENYAYFSPDSGDNFYVVPGFSGYRSRFTDESIFYLQNIFKIKWYGPFNVDHFSNWGD